MLLIEGIKMTNDKNAALASSNREHTKLMTSQEKQFKKELEVRRSLSHLRSTKLMFNLSLSQYPRL